MNFALKSLVAAAAIATTGFVNAAAITVGFNDGSVYNGGTFVGSGTLTFSPQLLGALDSGQVVVTAYSEAVPLIALDQDGFYSGVSVAAPIVSLTLDDTTGNLLSALTSGGATQTTTYVKSITNGGVLTVSDINADLANNVIRARVQGAAATGGYVFDQVIDLWSIGSITGDTRLAGPGHYTTTLSGLSITSQGFDVFVNSLQLIRGGVTALEGVSDFGTITSTFFYGNLLTPPVTPGIPEPSIYAMFGVGLLAVGAVARRRAFAAIK